MGLEHLSTGQADAVLHRTALYLGHPVVSELHLDYLSINRLQLDNDTRPYALLSMTTNDQAHIDAVAGLSDRTITGSNFTSWNDYDEGAVISRVRLTENNPFAFAEEGAIATASPVVAIKAIRKIIGSAPKEMRIRGLGGPSTESAVDFYSPRADEEAIFWIVEAEIPAGLPGLQPFLDRYYAMRHGSESTLYALTSDASDGPGARFTYRTGLNIDHQETPEG